MTSRSLPRRSAPGMGQTVRLLPEDKEAPPLWNSSGRISTKVITSSPVLLTGGDLRRPVTMLELLLGTGFAGGTSVAILVCAGNTNPFAYIWCLLANTTNIRDQVPW